VWPHSRAPDLLDPDRERLCTEMAMRWLPSACIQAEWDSSGDGRARKCSRRTYYAIIRGHHGDSGERFLGENSDGWCEPAMNRCCSEHVAELEGLSADEPAWAHTEGRV